MDKQVPVVVVKDTQYVPPYYFVYKRNLFFPLNKLFGFSIGEGKSIEEAKQTATHRLFYKRTIVEKNILWEPKENK
jgi:hypothetical protein